VTLRAIAGLAGLNALFLAAGAGLLWGIRGWGWWTELVRLLGVAYLLGVGSMATLLTLTLVAGVPFGWPALIASATALVVGGVLLGWRLGRRRPGLRPHGWRLPRLGVVSALWAAGIALYLEALFRSGRLAGESEWDAWRCWTIRAKALFEFGGLDREVFSSAACPGYPPAWSVVEASGFQAMGSVDVVTVHLQYWFLALGFVAALLGLLARRVRQAILLPFVLCLLVLPSLTERATDGRADLPLAYLAVVGAVLVLLWLEDRHAWRLPAATIVFAAALLTKREGLLLVAFVFVAAFAASWREWRPAWPRLAATAVGAVVLSLPWRIWLQAEELRSGAPPEGYLGVLDQADRAWPALRLVVRTFLDYDLWLLAIPLSSTAAVLAYLAGARRHAVFVATFTGASIVGCAWAIWSEPALEITQDYGLNPVVRLVGGPTLVLVALTPLVLERALAGGRQSRLAAAFWRVADAGRAGPLPWAIVAAALVGYPLSMFTGYGGLRLPGGLPEFPTQGECVVAVPTDGGRVRVVFGYAASYPDANALRDRARAEGFTSTHVAQDGCGRLRVFLDDVPTVATGRDISRSADAAGFEPSLEGDRDR
jgi:hypothetical protein